MNSKVLNTYTILLLENKISNIYKKDIFLTTLFYMEMMLDVKLSIFNRLNDIDVEIGVILFT